MGSVASLVYCWIAYPNNIAQLSAYNSSSDIHRQSAYFKQNIEKKIIRCLSNSEAHSELIQRLKPQCAADFKKIDIVN